MNTLNLTEIQEGFDADKETYWSMRDELLAKYRGKWIAVHKGRVVAVGDDPVSIMDEAICEDGYAYTNKVGEEEKIIVRKRRRKFNYAIVEPTSEPERLLGREVLNLCKVTFDGPKHQTIFH